MAHFGMNTAAISVLRADLARAGKALDRKILGPALVNASKPAVAAVEQEAPKGQGYQRVSLSRSRGRNNYYRRGGATKQDVRAKAVDGVGAKEEVRVLVGVSKRRGKVGWRTHFITMGTKRVRRTNAFINRGVDRTISQVINSFMASLTAKVRKVLSRVSP